MVRSLWLGRLAYPTVVSALETGLFEALDRGPATVPKLAKTLGVPARGIEVLTSGCAGLGLLKVRGDLSFEIAPAARPFVVRSSPYFFGAQLLAADGLQSSLRRALQRRDNKPVAKLEARSDAAVQAFAQSMEAHSAATAAVAAEVLDMSGVSSVLDMAGGSGCFARALERRHPRLRATVADLAPVVELHRRRTFGRVDAIAADLFDAATWPRGHDCVLLANVLHDWDEEGVEKILRAARKVLPPAGRCLIIEVLMDENRAGPKYAALYSVSMVLGDWRSGKQYSYADLKTMLAKAGFRDVERGPECGAFHSTIVARKEA
ncbi:hypothetical protein CTAYLR_009514 [Chrysophaeum taylorii]|uniref:O-methyltransferase C-terminal domain-containing protein n=1 Tax=Chrysophaeum taylorii TaxID=2483200 RepID=A0AAD7ULN8_9STRA|nr:hypothetical protein CTAYLR_009514 [Chrysophaeum taylorii]